jgi:hypothetical protein
MLAVNEIECLQVRTPHRTAVNVAAVALTECTAELRMADLQKFLPDVAVTPFF